VNPKPLAALSLILALAAPPLTGLDSAAAEARPCFAQIYDAAHLRRHPQQTVAGITVAYSSGRAMPFALDLGFRLKTSREWFGGTAQCSGKGEWYDCELEGDGGAFRLSSARPGLRLTVVNRGGNDIHKDQINVEGTHGFSGFGKPLGDDLSFILMPAPHKLCEPR
jgi:hypothetical protein